MKTMRQRIENHTIFALIIGLILSLVLSYTYDITEIKIISIAAIVTYAMTVLTGCVGTFLVSGYIIYPDEEEEE